MMSNCALENRIVIQNLPLVILECTVWISQHNTTSRVWKILHQKKQKTKKPLSLSFKLQASGLEQAWIIHSLIPHIHLTHLCCKFRATCHESGVTISCGNQSLADPSSDSNLLADSTCSWSWGWQMGLSGLGVKGRKQEIISALIKGWGCLTSPCNSFDSGNRQIETLSAAALIQLSLQQNHGGNNQSHLTRCRESQTHQWPDGRPTWTGWWHRNFKK